MLNENFDKRCLALQNAEDVASSVCNDEVDTTKIGLTSASAAADTVTKPSAADPSSSDHVRLDTQYRHPSDLDEEKRKVEEKLLQLSSTPAMERKRDFVGDGTDGATRPLDGTTFTIVDLNAVNTLLSHVKCYNLQW